MNPDMLFQITQLIAIMLIITCFCFCRVQALIQTSNIAQQKEGVQLVVLLAFSPFTTKAKSSMNAPAKVHMKRVFESNTNLI
jgi:hypothetical protein